jgi:hypothetical protein
MGAQLQQWQQKQRSTTAHTWHSGRGVHRRHGRAIAGGWAVAAVVVSSAAHVAVAACGRQRTSQAVASAAAASNEAGRGQGARRR